MVHLSQAFQISLFSKREFQLLMKVTLSVASVASAQPVSCNTVRCL